jgi:hypothetical protein
VRIAHRHRANSPGAAFVFVVILMLILRAFAAAVGESAAPWHRSQRLKGARERARWPILYVRGLATGARKGTGEHGSAV